MIVNIRGTNGSGKSTLVRQAMERFGRVPLYNDLGKEYAYEVPGLEGYVVGKYVTACGGCDAVKTQAEAKGLVSEFAVKGNVIFEGVLISTIFGPWLEFSRQNGGMLWAFLDTPYDVCLQRIQIRNGGKPVKEDQVLSKWETMRRVATKAKEAGEQVVWLDYREPLPALLAYMAPALRQKAA